MNTTTRFQQIWNLTTKQQKKKRNREGKQNESNKKKGKKKYPITQIVSRFK